VEWKQRSHKTKLKSHSTSTSVPALLDQNILIELLSKDGICVKKFWEEFMVSVVLQTP
jgi:hypothetical protein